MNTRSTQVARLYRIGREEEILRSQSVVIVKCSLVGLRVSYDGWHQRPFASDPVYSTWFFILPTHHALLWFNYLCYWDYMIYIKLRFEMLVLLKMSKVERWRWVLSSCQLKQCKPESTRVDPCVPGFRVLDMLSHSHLPNVLPIIPMLWKKRSPRSRPVVRIE